MENPVTYLPDNQYGVLDTTENKSDISELKIMKKLIIIIFLLGICSFSLIPHSFADLSDNMNVSATVQPSTANYQFDLGEEYGRSNISQQTQYTYVITYGAQQSAYFNTADTVITLNWGNDLAPNNLHMFDYVVGSASYGYENAPPIIDVTNRTITWIIPSLPAGTTDQKLYVALYSNTYDIPDHPFSVSLTATMSNQYVTMPEQTLEQTYTYKVPQPGPQPTPIPQQPTPTPTPTPQPSQITNVAITNVSNDTAAVRIETIGPSNVTVDYGTSPHNLNQLVSTKGYYYPNTVSFNNLLSDTWYYFRITSTDLSGQTNYSELYSFKTANKPLSINSDNNIIVFSTNGHVLLSDLQSQSNILNPSVILPINNDYEIAYTVENNSHLKSIDALIINKVLGQNTFMASDQPAELIIPMEEKAHSLYVANVESLTMGLYQVDVRLQDDNGDIVEKKIADLKVIPHLTVYAQDTDKPLADARVFFYYFDAQTNSYQPLSSQLFGPIQNPSYTNSLGQSMIILPAGNYRVDESALLYDEKSVDFVIGPGSGQNFPILYLKRDDFNMISAGSFVKNYFGDTWSKTNTALQNYASSIRVFHLFSVGILSSFILLSFLFFLFRSHIHIKHLPVFFLFNVHKLFNKHQLFYLFGTITDEHLMPISHALVEVEDADTKNIITEMTTNKAGKFYFKNSFTGSINLLITKEGYEPLKLETGIPKNELHIHLEKGEKHQISFIHFCIQGIEEILGLLFEVSLVISIILELIFLSIYGWDKVLLYFILSIVNIALWLFYLQEKSTIQQL